MAADIISLKHVRTRRAAEAAPQSPARIPLGDLVWVLAEEARVVAALGARILRTGARSEPECRRLITAMRRLQRGAAHLRERRL